MSVLAWVTGILLTVGFLASGVMKVIKHPMQVQSAQRLGYTNLLLPIGVAEILGAIGVFIGLLSDGKGLEWLGFLGGLGLLATMLVAIVFYHRKAGDSPKEMAPAGGLALLSILYLIGIMAR